MPLGEASFQDARLADMKGTKYIILSGMTAMVLLFSNEKGEPLLVNSDDYNKR